MESVLLFASTFGVTAFIIVFVFDFFISSPSYKGPISDHFDGRAFHNLSGGEKILSGPKKRGFLFVLTWLIYRSRNIWQRTPNRHIGKPEMRVNSKRIFVTFVNHSTLLLQTEGLNILVDPIWSERASPFTFLGPRRWRDPGIKFDDLPRIDIVLISNNHYDHMDIRTLRKIYDKYRPKIFVPLGNSSYLRKKGIVGTHDMDWWDKVMLSPETNLVSVPAMHFSARAFSDRNKTLWCGFVIETSRGNIYISGDIADGKFKEKIKEKYDKFILGFLPIGVWKPPWLMKSVHISPDEAFELHKYLNIETSVGVHFGTFRLSDDGQDEGPERIKQLVKESGPKQVDFRILEHGQTIMI